MTSPLFSALKLAWMAGSRGRAGRLFGLGLALVGSAQAGTLRASGTTLSGGTTNPWAGSGTRTAASATVLTVTPGATYNTINLTDSATGTAVTFNTSTANPYVDDFKVTLDTPPGAVTFNGASRFTGAFGLSITTARNIAFASASSLPPGNGNLTLDANT